MRNQKNKLRVNFTLLFAISSFFLACSNFAYDTAIITVSLGGAAAVSRTATGGYPPSDAGGPLVNPAFNSLTFKVLFNGVEKAGTKTINSSGDLEFEFTIAAGTYNINVEAYEGPLPTDPLYATGKAPGASVLAGQNNVVPIQMKEAVTVSFDLNYGGAPTPATIQAGQGDTISAPTAPTRGGFTFGGWYKEALCTNQWVFTSEPVAESVLAPYSPVDFTLYARWTASGSWGNTITAGGVSAVFNSIAVDNAGNIYAAGFQQGTGNYDYGSGNIAGTSTGDNLLLVKYDPSGTVLWARTMTAGSGDTFFSAIAVDSSGNVYAAGDQYGTGSYNYGGSSVPISGTSLNSNPVLVKYDPSGTALWARTISAGTVNARFRDVVIDNLGNNIYAVGFQDGNGLYSYGGGITGDITGPAAGLNGNPVLVKYDSLGNTLWAKTTSASFAGGGFYKIAVDNAGDIFVTGMQGAGTFDYGGSVTITGSGSTWNPVLVKYNSSGTALWAKTNTGAANVGRFDSVALDSSGNVYACGTQTGAGSFDYGNSVTIAGSSTGTNSVLLKCDSAGTALWANSITSGSGNSEFYDIAVDNTNNVFAAGWQNGAGNYNYGNGNIAGTCTGDNSALVKYDSSGTIQWARTITAGTISAYFCGVAIDSTGNVFVAGSQDGTGNYSYGSVNITGTCSASSPVLVKNMD